jgi:hypothetical protein
VEKKKCEYSSKGKGLDSPSLTVSCLWQKYCCLYFSVGSLMLVDMKVHNIFPFPYPFNFFSRRFEWRMHCKKMFGICGVCVVGSFHE